MKVKINDLQQGSKIEFNFKIDSLEDLNLKEPVEVTGTVYRVEDFYVVQGNYKTILDLQCVKCLKTITQNLEGNFDGKFLNPKSYEKYLSSLEEEEEMEDEIVGEASNGEIDILELVREYIILDLPLYPSCDPICEDTSVIDRYSDDGVDPRWQQLLQIKN